MEYSGLAKQIRECNGHEQYDLGGYNQQKTEKLIQDCFSTKIRNKGCSMTFLIGGGKATRSKYDPKMQKFMTAALVEVGYEEDRGASKETPGKFKYQHDTAKNLLFMHVYPHGEVDANTGGTNDNDEHSDDDDDNDPASLLYSIPASNFQAFCSKKARSYTAKERCLEKIKEGIHIMEKVEESLMNRQTVEDSQQAIYDNSVDLEEKSKYLQTLLQKHIQGDSEVEKLTNSEKEKVVEKIDQKMKRITEQMEKCTDSKKAVKMEQALKKTEEMKATVKSLSASQGLPLTHREKLVPLYRNRYNLERIENKPSPTIEEMRKCNNELPPLREEIERFQDMSAEIFETDDELLVRVNRLRKEVESSLQKATKSNKPASSNMDAWSTSSRQGPTKNRTSKQGKSSGNAFSALG